MCIRDRVNPVMLFKLNQEKGQGKKPKKAGVGGVSKSGGLKRLGFQITKAEQPKQEGKVKPLAQVEDFLSAQGIDIGESATSPTSRPPTAGKKKVSLVQASLGMGETSSEKERQQQALGRAASRAAMKKQPSQTPPSPTKRGSYAEKL